MNLAQPRVRYAILQEIGCTISTLMKSDTKQWLDIAKSDYDSCLYLFKGAYYPQALYLMCQAIEKVLKAAQVEFTGQVPKKTHHLENLAYKTDLSFLDDQIETLRNLTSHYNRVRYPDYRRAKYNTHAKVEPIINQGREIYQWILTVLNNQ